MKPKYIQTTISLFFAILLVFTSSGLGSASPLGETGVLVRIDLHSPEEANQLEALGIPIHKQIYGQPGQVSWLTFISSEQQLFLKAGGFSIKSIDTDPAGKDYFLVKLTTPNASRGLSNHSTVLSVLGDQAIVAITDNQAADFFSLGFEIEHLSRQPIPYPDEEAYDAPAPPLQPNPTIQQMLGQVSTLALSKQTGDLSGISPVMIGGSPYTILTRHSSNADASQMVTQYAFERFEALGLDADYHLYTHPYYGGRRNVVAEQPGIGQPERIFLITAHIDNMPGGAIAPGADDNASGSTGVLLAAKILSQYEFDCTLRYALFTGEEQGLWGSEAYAEDLAAAGENIEAVLNLDMIAYNSDTQPILDLHTRPNNQSDLSIANKFVDVIEAYNLNLVAHVFQDGVGYSDHASFWGVGIPAILAIEDDSDFTPYYHTVNDTLSSLDLTYFTNFVKASLGTFAHMGCLIPTTGTIQGTVTEDMQSTPIAGATLEASLGASVITSTISAADGSYSLELPIGTYTLSARHPSFIPESIPGVTVTEASTTTVNFSLEPGIPVGGLDFTHGSPSGTLGQTVIFTGTVVSGTQPITFNWDFGDGSQGMGVVITHSFPAGIFSATYTVTLTAENDYGPPQSAAKPFTVQENTFIVLPIILRPQP